MAGANLIPKFLQCDREDGIQNVNFVGTSFELYNSPAVLVPQITPQQALASNLLFSALTPNALAGPAATQTFFQMGSQVPVLVGETWTENFTNTDPTFPKTITFGAGYVPTTLVIPPGEQTQATFQVSSINPPTINIVPVTTALPLGTTSVPGASTVLQAINILQSELSGVPDPLSLVAVPGIIVMTNPAPAQAFTSVSIVGGTGITVVDGSGVLGNPMVSITPTIAPAGPISNPTITYNAEGQLTTVTPGTNLSNLTPAGIVFSNGITPVATLSTEVLTAGTGITVTSGNGIPGPPTVAITPTAVAPGSYTYSNITVNAEGQLTAASSGVAPQTTIAGQGFVISNGATPSVLTTEILTAGPGITVTNGNGAGVPTVGITNSIAPAVTVSNPIISYNAQGELTVVTAGTPQPNLNTLAPAGIVFSDGLSPSTYHTEVLTAGTGITIASGNGIPGPPTVSISNTGVAAGVYEYADITVNAAGQITAATNGVFPAGYVVSNGANPPVITGNTLIAPVGGNIAITNPTGVAGNSVFTSFVPTMNYSAIAQTVAGGAYIPITVTSDPVGYYTQASATQVGITFAGQYVITINFNVNSNGTFDSWAVQSNLATLFGSGSQSPNVAVSGLTAGQTRNTSVTFSHIFAAGDTFEIQNQNNVGNTGIQSVWFLTIIKTN